MSKHYTKDVASFASKKISRKKVATAIQDSMIDNSTIHYLGGTSTLTPFENTFRGKNVTFVRYEKLKSLLPCGYNQVSFSNRGEAILPSKGDKGYFCNGEFFECFFPLQEKLQPKQAHYWLDFCGMPQSHLLEAIYYTFFFEVEDNFKSLYLTFFLNPRNCEDVKTNLFKNGEKTTEQKAETLLNRFKEMTDGKGMDCEIFEIYNNGKAPMCVLKIERRKEIDNMTKTASLENYVRLHRKGFSNKQIAVFWRAGTMQVAGFAASAKRKKMI